MTKNFSENQRGSAGAKLLIALVVLFLIANAGYNVIPVVYQAGDIKQEVHTAVVQGSALPERVGNPAEITKKRILNYAEKSGVQNAIVEVKSDKGMMKGTIKYTKEIDVLPFGIYKYQYVVDHTDSPVGFLMKQ
ncbi:MAG: hypothetical protein MUC29_08515 [Pyrinomonadaceae bacterium]|jgi:hypothetical protein|nr:hypothetical protein [Pyrinomonadaceae bacterium]